MYVLSFTSGPLSGRRVEVRSAVTVGRQSADITIDDPEVSRRHAAFHLTDEGLQVEDLGSLNGTIVNHLPIHGSTLVRPGDVIEIGNTRVEVLEALDSDATAVRQRPRFAVAVTEPAPVPEPRGQSVTPPPAAPEGTTPERVEFDYSGERFVLGHGPDSYGIWDRLAPGQAIQRFALDGAGWAAAWELFSSWEPGAVPVRADGHAPAPAGSGATPASPPLPAGTPAPTGFVAPPWPANAVATAPPPAPFSPWGPAGPATAELETPETKQKEGWRIRAGGVTTAAVLLFVSAGLQVLGAVVLFSLRNESGVTSAVVPLAALSLGIGVVALVAGIEVLRRRRPGLVLGLLVGVLGTISGVVAVVRGAALAVVGLVLHLTIVVLLSQNRRAFR